MASKHSSAMGMGAGGGGRPDLAPSKARGGVHGGRRGAKPRHARRRAGAAAGAGRDGGTWIRSRGEEESLAPLGSARRREKARGFLTRGTTGTHHHLLKKRGKRVAWDTWLVLIVRADAFGVTWKVWRKAGPGKSQN